MANHPNESGEADISPEITVPQRSPLTELGQHAEHGSDVTGWAHNLPRTLKSLQKFGRKVLGTFKPRMNKASENMEVSQKVNIAARRWREEALTSCAIGSAVTCVRASQVLLRAGSKFSSEAYFPRAQPLHIYSSKRPPSSPSPGVSLTSFPPKPGCGLCIHF